MNPIETDTWKRRGPLTSFSNCEHPHFALCANIDITALRPYLKRCGVTFTIGMVYVISRAANSIPPFRYRIRDGEVIEHSIAHPAITMLRDDESLAFFVNTYQEDFQAFASGAAQLMRPNDGHRPARPRKRRDDMLMLSTIPWVSFTCMTHPSFSREDSVPRIAWGKYFWEGDRLKMPLSVQVHHGLMDGLHVGRLFERIQAYCDQPESVMGEV